MKDKENKLIDGHTICTHGLGPIFACTYMYIIDRKQNEVQVSIILMKKNYYSKTFFSRCGKWINSQLTINLILISSYFNIKYCL